MADEIIKGLTSSEKKAYDSLPKNLKSKLAKGFKRVSSAKDNAVDTGKKTVSDLAEPIDRVLSSTEALVASTRNFEKEYQNFFKAGYTAQMYDFSVSIAAANKESLRLYGNLSAGQETIKALRSNTMAIAVANESFSKSLIKSGVAMVGAGWNMTDFANIVDSATFAFNKNEAQVGNLTSTLIQIQREIPVSAADLAENFRFAQKNFAYSADKMMDNFIGLQKMSVTTGISFGDLTSAFGSSMDTFEGSAQKAGQLNQILGRSAFNSMELLAMTETERATKIRSAIMESGRSIEDMSKFELISLQKSIGLGSMEDTRKFLRGELKIDEKKSLKAIESRDPIAIKSKALNFSLGQLAEGIDRTIPTMDRLAIAQQNVGMALQKAGFMHVKEAEKQMKAGRSLEEVLIRAMGRITGQLTTEIEKNERRFKRKEVEALKFLKPKDADSAIAIVGKLAATKTLESSRTLSAAAGIFDGAVKDFAKIVGSPGTKPGTSAPPATTPPKPAPARAERK